ncbi:hypothetical protein [Microvirga splendida]|uniref:Uncharacterized protein n=1 Tax=Microvirga splendida TaxID=2795727 RepID=A0ABS0Y5I7_9HYPH|nr:hypothetical protein [Microvirga splendida]MBJ6127190.1 hypothetical protein [Microvirga splendida]
MRFVWLRKEKERVFGPSIVVREAAHREVHVRGELNLVLRSRAVRAPQVGKLSAGRQRSPAPTTAASDRWPSFAPVSIVPARRQGNAGASQSANASAGPKWRFALATASDRLEAAVTGERRTDRAFGTMLDHVSRGALPTALALPEPRGITRTSTEAVLAKPRSRTDARESHLQATVQQISLDWRGPPAKAAPEPERAQPSAAARTAPAEQGGQRTSEAGPSRALPRIEAVSQIEASVVDRLANDIMHRIERRARIERERHGL